MTECTTHDVSTMGAVQFVNITQPNDVRKTHIQGAIRRHVMKDIGRARRKRRRVQVVELRVCSPSTQPIQIDFAHAHDQALSTYPKIVYPVEIPRPPKASGVFGIDLNERDLQIVHFMRAEADRKYRPFHVVWIRIGLSDPTAFYLSLASTVLFQDHMRGVMHMEYYENKESMKYYNKALGQLNTRLAHPEDCVSVGVIATILGCVCHDTNVGNWSRWGIHLDGLDRISKLRGGLDGLENEIPLMAFWLDLVGRTVTNAPPRVSIPQELIVNTVQAGTPKLESFLSSLEAVCPQIPWIARICRQMQSIAEIVNANDHSVYFWEDEVGAIRVLGPVTHHILSVAREPSIGSHDQNGQLLGDLVRLASLMLISGLKKRFSLNSSDMTPLCKEFEHKSAECISHDNGPVGRLYLWTLITAALLQSSDTRVALIPQICLLMQSLGFSDPETAIDDVRGLIWINVLEAGEEVNLAREIDIYSVVTSLTLLDN